MTARAEVNDMLVRLAAGDRCALDQLYVATSGRLFAVVTRILGSHADAEEVLQEVYVRVWLNAGRFRAIELSPMTWLITVARNRALDRVRERRAASWHHHRSLGEEVTNDMDRDAVEDVADPSPSPEDAAIAASVRQCLACGLARLPATHAEAVRRAYLYGDTYADLAVHFDVPLNTMRTQLRRSLIKLRRYLEADGVAGP